MIKDVLIYGARYSVTETDNPIILDGKQCAGKVDYNLCEIKLNKTDMANGRVPVVLMHEITHAIFHENGLHDEAENEGLVEIVAHAIIDLIIHNPLLVKYMQEL